MDDEVIELFVEIPKGSRNKYEWDHHVQRFRLDRMLFTAVQYPGDYGFVLETFGGDGDPLDGLVILGEPTFPGCTIMTRVLGCFWMTDDKGRDTKIVGVPDSDPRWSDLRDLSDVPRHLLDEIAHFFSIYKDLEQKKVTVDGWGDKAAAMKEIAQDRETFRTMDDPPAMP
jgi:inorganic pyrophosphatase